jgi:hypothetical protein
MGVYFYTMEQVFDDMTKLHLDAYIATLNVRKSHCERELAQFTRVLSCIDDKMDGYDYIMGNIEQLVKKIMNCSSEITEAQKWQR